VGEGLRVSLRTEGFCAADASVCLRQSPCSELGSRAAAAAHTQYNSRRTKGKPTNFAVQAARTSPPRALEQPGCTLPAARLSPPLNRHTPSFRPNPVYSL
jgi:hypothetical protein